MPQKNNTYLIVFIVISIILFIVGGAYLWQQNKVFQEEISDLKTNKIKTNTNSIKSNNPLSYSINSNPISVSKENSQFNYTLDQLISMAQECGTSQTKEYFIDLISKFKNSKKITYSFKYLDQGQEADTFVVTILPNKASYASLEEYKKDFNQCYAGGNAYPKMMNENWLLFVNSCSTGFDDGSGKPIGCLEVRNIVEPTLQLN